MKFPTNFNKICIILIILITLTPNLLCLNKEKIQSELNTEKAQLNTKEKSSNKKFDFAFEKYEMNMKTFSKFYEKKKSFDTYTNLTLPDSLYKDLNTTFTVKDSYTFRKSNRAWDYKILDKQLEEIFATLLYKQQDRMTTNGVRNYMEIFMKNYQNCDQDKDNVLNQAEFTACMTSDPYFSQMMPPPDKYAAVHDYTNPAVFYTVLFNILNERYEGYVNFVGYMRMRLMAFSWRECSVFAPYLEEVDFECALEIASGYKTISRTTARNIFKIALEFSNNPTIRNLDFLSYFVTLKSVIIFGRVNSKEDNDISKSEFNLALDNNMLPIRYNQDIIDQMYMLLDDYDRPNQGIDLESFIYYDFFLQLFTFNNKARPYYLGIKDFNKVVNHMLFPNKTKNEIFFIPQYNLTASSYHMYQYINISQYVPESDYLYKFLEITNEVLLEKKSNLRKNVNYPINPLNTDGVTNLFNTTFTLSSTNQLLFDVLDTDNDGWLNFHDFGTFMQLGLVFSRVDEYNKGRVTAGNIYEKLKNYADYPAISFRLRERAERFTLLDQNIYMDLLSALQTVRIDDIVKYYNRKTDNQNVYEVELKKIFNKVNMKFVPDTYLNKCLRGVDSLTVPKYDWECSFIQGMNLNLRYYESMNNYNEVKMNNLTMLNTAFYNVDPNYK